jgi:hypothetical protein
MKMTGCHRETSAAVPREPPLSEVLNDPVVMAVMRADGVSPDALARILGIPVCSRSFGSSAQPTEIGSPGSSPAANNSRPAELPERLADQVPAVARPLVQLTRAEERKRDERIFFTDD